MAADSDSEYRLEHAIASVLRRKNKEAIFAVREAAGLEDRDAASWCVGQVYIRTRSGLRPSSAPSPAESGSHRPCCSHRSSPLVRPVWSAATMIICGSPSRDVITHGDSFAALTEWPADELADRGDPDDEQLRTALGRLAQRFVDADPDSEQARERADALFG